MNELTFNELPKTASPLFDKQISAIVVIYLLNYIRYSKRKNVKKRQKKLDHKKHKRFLKIDKLLKWLIQLLFIFVLRSMINNYCTFELPKLLKDILN